MLELVNVSKSFKRGLLHNGHQTVLDNVSFSLERGRTLGIMGDSGSGKTTLARIAVRTIDPDDGKVFLEDTDITSLSSNKMSLYRSQLQMIFQHPEGALNPELKLDESLSEALLKSGIPRSRLKDVKDDVCGEMNISPTLLNRYPMQVSGGEIQRVALARAMAFNPNYLFMDEPTSMLDVSIQAHILNFINEKSKRNNMGIVFITHDLDIVRKMCDDILILYRGNTIGLGTVEDILENNSHEQIKNLVDFWDASKNIEEHLKGATAQDL
jgi:ABC-type dipeptide/oligopeptide/nickel transport system, ATPase component